MSKPTLRSGALTFSLAAGCVSNPLRPLSGVCGLLERTEVRDSPIADRPREVEDRPFLSGSAKTVSPNLIVLGEVDFVPRTGWTKSTVGLGS